ncbi:MAG: GNAT family N-acetyltransferase [Phenylobacterium sp.]|uniref:GNAT family N-acetyltransferase n=1 Tax=Phenylobacterium sp. TaxID=1871053 RepID=UPI001B644638|nr:GNAT family N-acetyltransferase [Phenylobacterium sp.]MBP6545137.1 GNAT family N-acetyltransferase [Phenylobacterium sp.]MBP7817348.1 GNAT family N-acetyltransferase [Phenylobacterium sp.]
MAAPVFRSARREDVARIVELLADDPLGAGRERFEDPLPDNYYAAFDRIEASDGNVLTVAELDGAVVACLQMTFIPGLSNQGADLALIEGVRVDTRLRSQGLGAQLIEWALETARARDCQAVELFTHKTRTEAHRFYDRLGFEQSHVGYRIKLSENQRG